MGRWFPGGRNSTRGLNLIDDNYDDDDDDDDNNNNNNNNNNSNNNREVNAEWRRALSKVV